MVCSASSKRTLASRLIEGDTAYQDIHDALMVMRSDVSETSLTRLAGDLGYDGEAILAGMDDPSIQEVISANYALAQAMQISGTPTFVIGDELVRGFVPGEQMAQIVGAARQAAE